VSLKYIGVTEMEGVTETGDPVSVDEEGTEKPDGTRARVGRRSSERQQSRSSEEKGSCIYNMARCHIAFSR